MAKIKSHLQMGRAAQKTKKAPKPQVKSKSKLRKKIFVKGGLRDGHTGTTTNKIGVEEQASKKNGTMHKGNNAEAGESTPMKKLPEVTVVQKNSGKGDQPLVKENGKLGKRRKRAKRTEIDGQRGNQTTSSIKKQSTKAKLISKSGKKTNEKEKETDAVLPVEVKKAVTNIKKSSKEKVSSNWEAFKQIGLHKTYEKPKPEFDGIFRNKRKPMQGKNGPSKITIKDEEVVNEGDLNSLDLEDSYIKDLLPPEGDSIKELTKCIAIDCEMVGVGDGKESALARVSLVNQHGACIYDKFVKPKEDVIDYRTKVSGVRPADLALGEDLEVVQKEVAKIVAGRVLVGHALRHDLKVLFLSHPYNLTRDTSKFKPFKDMFNGQTPSLKNLTLKILGVGIQSGEHSSVEDAKATMQLYNLYSKEWEEQRRLWALRKRERWGKDGKQEKMEKLLQEKNAKTTHNDQAVKEKKQTKTLRNNGVPYKSAAAMMVGIDIVDEHMDG